MREQISFPGLPSLHRFSRIPSPHTKEKVLRQNGFPRQHFVTCFGFSTYLEEGPLVELPRREERQRPFATLPRLSILRVWSGRELRFAAFFFMKEFDFHHVG